jgi:hypothetical protein
MHAFRRSALAVLMGTTLAAPQRVLAFGHGTADARPPAEVVDDPTVGRHGPAHGLRVAYGEAHDGELEMTSAERTRSPRS